jgi:serine protease Do
MWVLSLFAMASADVFEGLDRAETSDRIAAIAAEHPNAVIATRDPGGDQIVREVQADGRPNLRRFRIGTTNAAVAWMRAQTRFSARCMVLVVRSDVSRFDVGTYGDCAAAAGEEGPKPPPSIAVSPDAESVTVAALVVRDEIGAVVGVSGEDLRLLLLERLRASGLDVRGGESVVFGQDHSDRARFAIGGTVESYQGSGDHREVAIHWELRDLFLDANVYEVTTRGVATGSPSEAARPAVIDALDRLVVRPPFLSALVPERPSDTLPAAAWEAPLTIRACTAPTLVLPADLERAVDAVVVVKTEAGTGSGVMVSPDGFLLTAAHVATDNDVEVRLRGDQRMLGEVVRIDHAQDVAIVKVGGSGYPCRPLRAAPATLGEDLFAVGSPLGTALDYSVSRGIVSGSREFGGTRFVQTDASINAGNSGGPLFDRAGAIVGVVSWKVAAPGFEGLGFGVPSTAVEERLGLVLGATSDADWSERSGAVGQRAEDVSRFIDEPDPSRLPTFRTPLEPTEFSVKGLPRGAPLYVLGGLMTVAGIAIAAGTGAEAASDDHIGDARWTALVAWNTAGWSLAGLGPLVALGGAAL